MTASLTFTKYYKTQLNSRINMTTTLPIYSVSINYFFFKPVLSFLIHFFISHSSSLNITKTFYIFVFYISNISDFAGLILLPVVPNDSCLRGFFLSVLVFTISSYSLKCYLKEFLEAWV